MSGAFYYFFEKNTYLQEVEILNNSIIYFNKIKNIKLIDNSYDLDKVNEFYNNFYINNNYNSYFVYFNVA